MKKKARLVPDQVYPRLSVGDSGSKPTHCNQTQSSTPCCHLPQPQRFRFGVPHSWAAQLPKDTTTARRCSPLQWKLADKLQATRTRLCVVNLYLSLTTQAASKTQILGTLADYSAGTCVRLKIRAHAEQESSTRQPSILEAVAEEERCQI